MQEFPPKDDSFSDLIITFAMTILEVFAPFYYNAKTSFFPEIAKLLT